MFDLTGKVAIVTGGSRGIGRAVALTLARQGAEIAFLDRLACTVEDHTRDDVEAMGRRCVCLGGDVTDAAACGASPKPGRAKSLPQWCVARMSAARPALEARSRVGLRGRDPARVLDPKSFPEIHRFNKRMNREDEPG